jgi:hypothetical protein
MDTLGEEVPAKNSAVLTVARVASLAPTLYRSS